MKGPLAMLMAMPLVIWLWRRDRMDRPQFSKAIWIPFLWVMVIASRPLSFWLGIGGGGNDLEGNSFDRILYLLQIFAAIYIVTNRGFRWNELTSQNRMLLIFYLYVLMTMLWAPYSFVVFKRWFKDIGSIFVMLIIITEENPMQALYALFARSAYVLFPLSVICIKFFPVIGRSYTRGGVPSNTGVTMQKNSLGEICFVFGLFVMSELAQAHGLTFKKLLKGPMLARTVILAMALYLLILCDSKTSLISFMAGGAVLFAHKLRAFRENPGKLVALMIVGPVLFFAVDSVFHVSNLMLGAIGRDATLTERTAIWSALKANPVNNLVGEGYMMFWDTHRSMQVGEFTIDNFKTIHNGYIEVYLDGGSIGVCLLVLTLLVTGARSVRRFMTNSAYGRLSLAIFVVILIYNISESAYMRRSPLWFAFMLVTLEVPRWMPGRVDETAEETEPTDALAEVHDLNEEPMVS